MSSFFFFFSFLPHSDKVFSERTNHLFVWYQQRETWGTGAPDEMSDGRKCFQQLLLQWVEHIQSIPKQIKSSGQSEWGGVGVCVCGGGTEPAATELDGDRRNTKTRWSWFYFDGEMSPRKSFAFVSRVGINNSNHIARDVKKPHRPYNRAACKYLGL